MSLTAQHSSFDSANFQKSALQTLAAALLLVPTAARWHCATSFQKRFIWTFNDRLNQPTVSLSQNEEST